MIEHIPDLVDAGIDSLKIEGRMKTALYVATVARTYRKALDDYEKDPTLYEKNMPWYLDQISNCTYRQFTTGFFYGKPDENAQIYNSNTYVKEYTYLGIAWEIDGDGRCRIEQRNKFSVGETIEIMKPDGRNVEAVVEGIWNAEDGSSQESAPHPKQVLWVKLSVCPDPMDILRRQEPEQEKN
jgi:putative protease